MSAVTDKAASKLHRSPHSAAKHSSDEGEAKPARADFATADDATDFAAAFHGNVVGQEESRAA